MVLAATREDDRADSPYAIKRVHDGGFA